MVCIAMEESSSSLRCSFTKGRAHSMLQGASAKSLLSFLPEPIQHSLLEAHAEPDSVDLCALRKEIAWIRKKGYATSDSEVDQGVWGVSVPLISAEGALEGTITLMAPSLRVGPREAELISLTRKAASRICKRI
jgi:DNA-binding IclR family transcriptional regulator